MGYQIPEIKVLFGNRESLTGPLPDNTLLIVPSKDKWNDFKYRTRVEFRVRLADVVDEFITHGFIGFISSLDNAPNGAEMLEEIVKGAGSFTLPADFQHKFFTMLPSMESYRDVVRRLTPEGAAAILTAAQDVVAIREFKPSSNWLQAAVNTEVFLMSFIRDSESFFAYKNAGSLLRGLELEKLGLLSQSLLIRFQLSGFIGLHDIKFNFDHNSDLPKRISILIGKNGVGKSQTLGRIARAALNGNEELTDGENDGRALISRLLAFAPTNEVGSVLPVDRSRFPRIWYKRFSMNRSRGSRNNDNIGDLIIQLVRSHQTIGEMSRWDIFIGALKGINAFEQICLFTRDSQVSFVNLIKLNRANEQRLLERFASIDLHREPVRVIDNKGYPLSSGELSFLKFAAQVSLHIENGSLLLLDEPETHLHPNFISRFVSLLEHLLEMTGSSAIIATHSAYFVREVFREQVTVLRIDEEGRVQSERPRLRTFGADVGAISYFVFGEDEQSKLAADVKKRLVEGGLSWETIYEKYKEELSYEFLMSIRSSIDEGALP